MQRPLDWEDPALAFAGGVGADRHQQAATHAPAAGSSPTRALKSAISIECPDFMRLKHVGVLDRASGPARHVRWWEAPAEGPDRVGVVCDSLSLSPFLLPHCYKYYYHYY